MGAQPIWMYEGKLDTLVFAGRAQKSQDDVVSLPRWRITKLVGAMVSLTRLVAATRRFSSVSSWV